MYVYEQYSNKKPACEWIPDDKVIEEIQTQIDDIAAGFGMIGAFCQYEDQIDEPDEDDNEFVKAQYNEIMEYAADGGNFPALVVTLPGRTPEESYEVWNESDAEDVNNWIDLLDEWTAFSNEYNYGVRPYFFADAAAEWINAWNAKDVRKADVIAEAADLKPFVTRDREAGNVIDEFQTLDDARDAVESYEADDERDGNLTDNFYEIYNQLTEEIVE